MPTWGTEFGTMKIIDSQKLFGTSVKVSRNLLGISQETLAERAELHRTYISDLERGARNPSLKTIIRLAHALEVTIAALFPVELEYWKAKGAHLESLQSNFVDILLVEDDVDDVELTLKSFQLARFENRIHVVSDGPEALDYLFGRGKYAGRSTEPATQVVLLDLSLPKLSGLEVLRRIKADPKTASLPVVVLTGSSQHKDIAECRRLGAVTYITKPLTWNVFAPAMKKLNLNWVLLKPPATPLAAARV